MQHYRRRWDGQLLFKGAMPESCVWDQAATLCFVSFWAIPLTKLTPVITSATRWDPFNLIHRFCADSSNLNVIVNAV